MKIVIVEDDPGIRKELKQLLENAFYEAEIIEEFKDTAEQICSMIPAPDLVLLDWNLPGDSGFDICTKLKEHSDIPIIFLTSRTDSMDELTGILKGADDYITKPFEPMELIARVNSNLRRYEQILNLKGSTQTPSNQLIVGGLVLDQATKEVFVNGQSVRLTKKEFQILELLMSYPGKVYSAEEIYESIWEETAINTETIMVHVRRLREKIEANPKHPEYLKAVWGVGYKIEKME